METLCCMWKRWYFLHCVTYTNVHDNFSQVCEIVVCLLWENGNNKMLIYVEYVSVFSFLAVFKNPVFSFDLDPMVTVCVTLWLGYDDQVLYKVY